MRFLYFYLMKETPERVRAIAPAHAAYWQQLGLGNHVGGPFADRSGGSITFDADSDGRADQLTANDPFRREDLIERYWLKEWLAD
jgi:uncharacterized protein YciI